ncbi:MAG: SAM-dependent methyltransferase [Clostridia bacterium]|nr:SAM-dependent methyltransferase [Clostridia bacterium]
MLCLTPRLQAIADYAQKGKVLADIGTDHAYIPVYLIEQGIIPAAFACDIRKGPLENARKTANKYGIDSIEFVLSDGLQGLENRADAFSQIVIAGMGGELIAEILSKSPWCADKHYHFVLQPMTRASFLRKWLYQNGFEILQESVAKEHNKLYNIMKVRYCAKFSALSEVQALLGFVNDKSDAAALREAELKRLNKIYESLKNKENSLSQREEIAALIREVEVYR